MTKLQHFSIKAASDGYTYIEGIANKAVVDRGNDLIDPKAWDLKNYMKNPVLLYNHDRDKIIGRAVDIKPQEDGLYIKARISKSRDGMVSYVRDMIEEGMINAFSVGFASRDAQKAKDGVNQIKQAELYEVSVVSIPMNQDSLFAVSMKDIAAAGNLRDVRRKFLEAKAASESVLQLQDMLDAMENLGANREECVMGLCKACGMTRDEMRDILAGDGGDVPEAVMAEAKKMLDELRKNSGNTESPEAKESEDMETPADEEAEKSVGIPGNGSEMAVQTDIQSIMTQNNVLIASLITEVQKTNQLLTQYLASEVAEEAEDEMEDEGEMEGEDEKPDAAAPAGDQAPAAPVQESGKTSDEEEATHKLIEIKLAEIKATLDRVKKTAVL